MSYTLELIVDKPVGLWSLDGSYANAIAGGSVTTVGSPTDYLPLIKDATSSKLLSNTDQIILPVSVYRSGLKENFSLEAWVNPIEFGSTKILSHTSYSDGLYMTDNGFGFLVTFSSASDMVIEANLSFQQRTHLVGTFDGESIVFYINGNIISTAALTDEQRADISPTFGDSGKLHCGGGTDIQVAGLAVYNYALTPTQVQTHYELGDSDIECQDIALLDAGGIWRLLDEEANIQLRYDIDTDDEWNNATLDGITPANDILAPGTDDDGEPTGGTWQQSIPLYDGDTIASSKIYWNGYGVVEWSTDGTTFTAAQNGGTISGINGVTVEEDTDLEVRVTLAPDQFMSDLHIIFYEDRLVAGVANDRPLTLTGQALPSHITAEVIDYDSQRGVDVTNGTITIGNDPADQQIYGYELWIKLDSIPSSTTNIISGDESLTFNGSTWAGSVDLHTNGSGTAFVPKPNTWVQLTAMFSAADPSITIGPFPGRVGHITALESTYRILPTEYFGSPSVRFTTSSTITMTNSAADLEFYDNPWSISAAG